MSENKIIVIGDHMPKMISVVESQYKTLTAEIEDLEDAASILKYEHGELRKEIDSLKADKKRLGKQIRIHADVIHHRNETITELEVALAEMTIKNCDHFIKGCDVSLMTCPTCNGVWDRETMNYVALKKEGE